MLVLLLALYAEQVPLDRVSRAVLICRASDELLVLRVTDGVDGDEKKNETRKFDWEYIGKKRINNVGWKTAELSFKRTFDRLRGKEKYSCLSCLKAAPLL